MKLYEVNNSQLASDFLKVNVDLNNQDPNYIQPLDKDVNDVFDPKKNKSFRQGRITRWVLKNDDGKNIGRIAAFTNKKYRNKGDDVPVGGISFFDCINDQSAADMLFDVAKHWLLQQGMQAMDGPINFGEKDRWWGLLVKGFNPPLYLMNFNPPYYQELFEKYGFKNFYNQVCYAMSVDETLSPRWFNRHAEFAKNPDFRSAHIKKDQLEKFADDFTIVYNKAWAGHGGMKTLDKKVVTNMFKSMKPVMDEKLSWFVYYKEAPVGIWINIPDINQWFRFLHGKFSLWSKLKFLWLKRTKKCNRFVGVVFGIVPEWQGKGIDSYMIIEGANVIQGNPGEYEVYEMQWIGEFNPKMINVVENLTTNRSRILTTYRYLFDRTKEFKRHPMVS